MQMPSPYRGRSWFLTICVLLVAGFVCAFNPRQPQLYAEESTPDEPGSISGVVTDREGNPLPDITVSLLGRDDLLQDFDPYGIVDTLTKADGSYRLSLLGPGLYYVKFSDFAHQYATGFYSATIDPDAAVLIPIAGNQVTGIDAVMQSGGQISGTITTATGITLTDLSAQLFQYFELSNGPYWYPMRTLWLEPNAQEYTFGGLGSGQYRICVNGTTSAAQQWFECYDNVSSLARGTTITFTTEAVSQGQIRANIDFRLGDGADRGSIQGRVRNVDGEPLAEITTVLIPVPIVTPITSSLLAPSGTAGPSHRKGQNATPLSWAAPANEPAATAHQDGIPFYPTTQTDNSGAYTFTAISPGQYILTFYDVDQTYASEYYPDAYLFDGADILHIITNTVYLADEMVLQRAGQITGTITVLGESAYVGEVYAVLNGRYERGSGFGAQIDPKTGNYTLRGLPTGTYRIEASVRTSAATYQGFYPNGETIEEGEDVHLGIGQTLTDINMDIVYGPHFNGAIWGHVRAAGKALAGIRVDLINGCCTPSVVTYTFSDEKGAYAFNGLQENSVWTVAFVDPSGRYGRTFAGNSATLEGAAYYSAIAGIDTNVDADLQPGGRIRGAIHRNDGQPVSNLQVIVYLMLDGRAYQVANSTTTAADGTYDLGGLHIGTYRFCFRQVRPGAIECFSTIDGLENAYLGTDVQVAVDQTTEVNMVWGPDYEQYLPVVSR